MPTSAISIPVSPTTVNNAKCKAGFYIWKVHTRSMTLWEHECMGTRVHGNTRAWEHCMSAQRTLHCILYCVNKKGCYTILYNSGQGDIIRNIMYNVSIHTVMHMLYAAHTQRITLFTQ